MYVRIVWVHVLDQGRKETQETEEDDTSHIGCSVKHWDEKLIYYRWDNLLSQTLFSDHDDLLGNVICNRPLDRVVCSYDANVHRFTAFEKSFVAQV